MENLFVKLVILAAIAQFGFSLADLGGCRSEECLRKIERLSREVVRVEWRVISVFPEEGRRFR